MDSVWQRTARYEIRSRAAVLSPAIDIAAGYRELADIQILRARTSRITTRENVIRPATDVYISNTAQHTNGDTFLNVQRFAAAWILIPRERSRTQFILAEIFRELGNKNEKLIVICFIVDVCGNGKIVCQTNGCWCIYIFLRL